MRRVRNQRISDRKLNEIIKYFSEDQTATFTAKETRLNLNTVNRYYSIFRELIYKDSVKESVELLSGEIELDESYFGAKRVRGKKGRGAGGKIPVFGILKRNGKVYVKVIKNTSRKELLPIIQGKVLEGSEIYTDSWKSYDGLIRNYRHYRIRHHRNEFARGNNHINGIESFWSYCKRRFRRLNTVRKSLFVIYLKESEWRFNHRNDNIRKLIRNLLKIFKIHKLSS